MSSIFERGNDFAIQTYPVPKNYISGYKWIDVQKFKIHETHLKWKKKREN